MKLLYFSASDISSPSGHQRDTKRHLGASLPAVYSGRFMPFVERTASSLHRERRDEGKRGREDVSECDDRVDETHEASLYS